jgi:NAD/NADP transhydrogenase alpha subunit
VAKAQAAGVKTGTVAYTPELAKSVVDRGFDMVVASVAGLFGNAGKAYLQACKN